MEAKILTDYEKFYINKDNKYYNLDSFFGFELSHGLDGLVVYFHSKYGSEHDLVIELDSDNPEDAKKELENFLELSDAKNTDNGIDYSQDIIE